MSVSLEICSSQFLHVCVQELALGGRVTSSGQITNDARCQQTHNLVFLIHQHISFGEALEMAFNLRSIQ